MAATSSADGLVARLVARFIGWRNAKIASPAFQSWASGFPLTRGVARRDGERLFDLVAGFVYSQTLLACVELGVLRALARGPASAEALTAASAAPPSVDNMARLCRAAAAIGLVERLPDGRFRLARLGAAALGAPGLEEMIRHHRSVYRDLADPDALLRGEVATETSAFWSYVGAGADVSAESAAVYSRLMAQSQAMVAEETLRAVSLVGVRRLLDIGGGEGAFLSAVAAARPGLELALLDVPEVARRAEARFAATGLADRARAIGGDFLDPLPDIGADAISLVRVLYDHGDETVARLLDNVFAALPPGGRIIVSEPMSGGARPSRAGDAYFGFYTLAMGSGRPRSAARHLELLRAAGFERARARRTARPFVTGVVEARRPRRAR